MRKTFWNVTQACLRAGSSTIKSLDCAIAAPLRVGDGATGATREFGLEPAFTYGV